MTVHVIGPPVESVDDAAIIDVINFVNGRFADAHPNTVMSFVTSYLLQVILTSENVFESPFDWDAFQQDFAEKLAEARVFVATEGSRLQ